MAAKPYTARQERVGTAVTRAMSKVNIALLRATRGRVGGRFPGGGRIGLLTTTGRKTGQPRTVALLYITDGDDLVFVASKGGMPHHPLWYLNLVADPNVTVEIDQEQRPMTARTATPEEKKVRLWPRLVASYKGYDGYQGRTERDIPVVICSPRQ